MIIKNCVKCKSCGDIIISTHRHDFKRCSCGRVAIDGGHDYLKRSFTDSPDDFEELEILLKNMLISIMLTQIWLRLLCIMKALPDIKED